MKTEELIYDLFYDEKRASKKYNNLIEEEQKFINKLTVKQCREYYKIVELITDKYTKVQLELIKFVMDFYKNILNK